MQSLPSVELEQSREKRDERLEDGDGGEGEEMEDGGWRGRSKRTLSRGTRERGRRLN
jgi:hypothetical protein